MFVGFVVNSEKPAMLLVLSMGEGLCKPTPSQESD